ncbi:MAG: class I mannose-6-phosphate isomerase [Actinomycetota bacterium]|nr:class I mannose-6-phosphate isomerase [Actinomycetota bacterium]
MKPLFLPANRPPRFFRGGGEIARLRGLDAGGDRLPEDWVASTTTIFTEPDAGRTRLPDGRWLTDAIAADPQGWLGATHADHYGADPALLVKLLDAGQRLPVHCHPDRDFTRRHLDCRYGKTEAWVVAATGVGEPVVHLGFRSDVERPVLDEWVTTQNAAAMLDAMNAVPVTVGNTVLVPAGLPHAIGEGVFVVELQEPTDFSVLLEWDGFEVDGSVDGHLRLGFELALACVDRSGWDQIRLSQLRTTRPQAADRCGVEVLFPASADACFRGERLRPQPTAQLDAGYSVLVALRGRGRLTTERAGSYDITRGDTVLLPYAVGRAAVAGDLLAVRCRPPAAEMPASLRGPR